MRTNEIICINSIGSGFQEALDKTFAGNQYLWCMEVHAKPSAEGCGVPSSPSVRPDQPRHILGKIIGPHPKPGESEDPVSPPASQVLMIVANIREPLPSLELLVLLL